MEGGLRGMIDLRCVESLEGCNPACKAPGCSADLRRYGCKDAETNVDEVADEELDVSQC